MSTPETQWILCPVCHGKTRTQIRKDTVLQNFPLFCPKCKRSFLISLRECKTEYETSQTPRRRANLMGNQIRSAVVLLFQRIEGEQKQ